MRIPFNDLQRSSSRDLELKEEAIGKVIRSGVFFFGPETEAFEHELGEFLGTPNVALVGNGTDALEIALLALGVGPGDLVLTVANAGGYATTAILKCGAQVGYVDVSALTLQMDPQRLVEALDLPGQKPKAIILTHLYGYMAPSEQIVSICRERGVLVLEDCAQGIGLRLAGTHVGNFGDIGTLSFYPTKNLGGAGDSGAIFGAHSEYTLRARQLAQYGWGEKYHNDVVMGRNSRIDEIQSAILRLNLRHLEADNIRRCQIVGRLAAELGHLLFPHNDGKPYNGHLTVVLHQERDHLANFLGERGVKSAVHYPVPDHRQLAWNAPEVSLPVTEFYSEQILSLPVFPQLSASEVDYLIGVIGEWRP
jgi:dTDP-3-amino-2,3,6-trideoxy-4-keto-D-glucose/dTDP-3-amino-3,4,6-trideoxy-alpha-D-glucose/dTDP-2,6-dideoxy-D-kanosamine transaminase